MLYEPSIFGLQVMKNYFLMLFLVILVSSFSLQQISAESNDRSNLDKEGIKWIDHCIVENTLSTVMVSDYDMNKDPEEREWFDIEVWSDSDSHGINLTLMETDANAGVFEGTVFFYTTDDGFANRVQAFAGDVVFARYVDDASQDKTSERETIPELIAELPVLERIGNQEALKITYGPCTISYLEKIKGDAPPPYLEMVFPAPLKQIESGLYLDEIQCKEYLTLVTKHDGTPACVKEQTVPKLIERDWLFDPVNNIIKQCAIEYDKIMRIPGCPSSGDGPVCEPKPLIAKFIEPSDEIANFKKMHCADNVDEWSHLTEHEDPNNGQIDWKLVSDIHHENPTFDVYGLNEKFQPIKVGKEIRSTIQYWDIVSCFDAETRIIDKLTNEIVFENIYTYECKNKQVGTFDKMMLRITDDVNWKIKLPGFYVLELESEKINLTEEFFVECTSGGCEFLTDEQLEGRQKHQGHYD